jgi:hypothetical protein
MVVDVQFVQLLVSLAVILVIVMESHLAEDVTEAIKREKEECNITNTDVNLVKRYLTKRFPIYYL